ncbi:MAG: glycosyltransferase [Thermoplasmata archaeon]|nr:glycosyltransferase [Thermoplasmata archaeon]
MPSVSVVVVAFDRRRYIVQAVRSALAQSLPRAEYEIIVITNFADPELELVAAREGITILQRTNPLQGSWIVEAADLARSDILAFLDDDDLFLPDKLRVVSGAFAADPRLTFFHNGIEYLRGEGGDPRTPRVPSALPGPSVGPRTFDADLARPAELLAAFAAGGSFNLSSIAVRTGAVRRARPALAKVRAASSAFLFYAAWAYGGRVLLDPTVLTRYRIHEYNASGTGVTDASLRWRRLASLAPSLAADAGVILDLIRSSRLDPRVGRPVEIALARQAVLLSATDPTVPRRSVLRQAFALLVVSGARGLRTSAPYLLLAVARAGSPGLSARWPGLGAIPGGARTGPRTPA